MNRNLSALSSLALVLSLAAFPAAAWEKMSSAKEISSTVAGQKLVSTSGRGWMTIRRSGILTGGYKGLKLKGSWRVKDGYFCFNTELGGKEQKDCALFQKHKNGQVRIVRERGKGRKNVYTIE